MRHGVDPAAFLPNGTELGDFAEVTLDCDFRPLTPIIGDVFASSGHAFGVSARSVFPIRTGPWQVRHRHRHRTAASRASRAAPPTPLPAMRSVSTTASACSAGAWTWTFGDGGAAANTGTPLHTYMDAGTYTVQMSSTSNGTPCTPYQVEITVDAPPPPPPPPPPDTCLTYFTWSPVNPIPGEVVSFTDGTPPTASNWNWTFGDGATADIRDPSHAYASAGTYAGRASDPTVRARHALPTWPTSSSVPHHCPHARCPGLSGTWHYDAQKAWKDAGFTTTVDLAPGDKQNQNLIILWQSLVGGQPVPCNASVTISASQPKKP